MKLAFEHALTSIFIPSFIGGILWYILHTMIFWDVLPSSFPLLSVVGWFLISLTIGTRYASKNVTKRTKLSNWELHKSFNIFFLLWFWMFIFSIYKNYSDMMYILEWGIVIVILSLLIISTKSIFLEYGWTEKKS